MLVNNKPILAKREEGRKREIDNCQFIATYAVK